MAASPLPAHCSPVASATGGIKGSVEPSQGRGAAAQRLQERVPVSRTGHPIITYQRFLFPVSVLSSLLPGSHSR